MTPKQKRFVDEYLIDLNATQAAIRAGYSEKTAGQIGDENLKKPEIAKAVEGRMAAREERTEITQDKVLAALANVAFQDHRKMFFENGELVPITAMDDDTAAFLAGFEVVTSSKGEGVVEHIAKVKTNDRMKALEMLGRHLKMFTDKQEHSFNPMESVLQRIYAEKRGE